MSLLPRQIQSYSTHQQGQRTTTFLHHHNVLPVVLRALKNLRPSNPSKWPETGSRQFLDLSWQLPETGSIYFFQKHFSNLKVSQDRREKVNYFKSFFCCRPALSPTRRSCPPLGPLTWSRYWTTADIPVLRSRSRLELDVLAGARAGLKVRHHLRLNGNNSGWYSCCLFQRWLTSNLKKQTFLVKKVGCF